MPHPSVSDRPRVPFERLSDAQRAASLRSLLAAAPKHQDIWIFAYGSMMWQPLFEPAERSAATLAGYRRSFCVWSLVSRGTPERPGLALGLEPCAGATCRGIVFRLDPGTAEADLEATWRREMYTAIYRPQWLEVATDAGAVPAIAFAVDNEHPQHAAGLTPSEAAAIIAEAVGENGACREYLANTSRELAALGCTDPQITALDELVQARVSALES